MIIEDNCRPVDLAADHLTDHHSQHCSHECGSTGAHPLATTANHGGSRPSTPDTIGACLQVMKLNDAIDSTWKRFDLGGKTLLLLSALTVCSRQRIPEEVRMMAISARAPNTNKHSTPKTMSVLETADSNPTKLHSQAKARVECAAITIHQSGN